MGRVSWVVWVGLKCNHLYPYKSEVEEDLKYAEGEGAM